MVPPGEGDLGSASARGRPGPPPTCTAVRGKPSTTKPRSSLLVRGKAGGGGGRAQPKSDARPRRAVELGWRAAARGGGAGKPRTCPSLRPALSERRGAVTRERSTATQPTAHQPHPPPASPVRPAAARPAAGRTPESPAPLGGSGSSLGFAIFRALDPPKQPAHRARGRACDKSRRPASIRGAATQWRLVSRGKAHHLPGVNEAAGLGVGLLWGWGGSGGGGAGLGRLAGAWGAVGPVALRSGGSQGGFTSRQAER